MRQPAASQPADQRRVLVVAYGNPLRGDDGLAWRVAEELTRRALRPNVEILERHQLAPELAEDLSRAEAVIFVDAASPQLWNGRPGEIRVAEISEQEPHRSAASPFHHQYSPASLLELAGYLYHARPRAFCVTLTGESFDAGEGLSSAIEAALPKFVARIEKLIRELIKPTP